MNRSPSRAHESTQTQAEFVAVTTVSAFTHHVPYIVSLERERLEFEGWQRTKNRFAKVFLITGGVVGGILGGITFVWIGQSEYQWRFLNDELTRLSLMAVVMFVIGLALSLPLALGIRRRRAEAVWSERQKRTLGYLMSDFLKKALQLLPDAKSAVTRTGQLVVFAPRGLILADVAADTLILTPAVMIKDARLQERARPVSSPDESPSPLAAGLVGATLTSVLFGDANLGATLGAAHGLGRSVSQLHHAYSWTVDVYTRDPSTPLLMLDFAGDEAGAKLCHATLLLTQPES